MRKKLRRHLGSRIELTWTSRDAQPKVTVEFHISIGPFPGLRFELPPLC